MKIHTLLRIDSSLRMENSYSRKAGDSFAMEWQKRNPQGKIELREVGKNMIPHLDQITLESFHQEANSSGLLKLSDELIEELYACDAMLITAPMYNFGISSSLKAYFDLVVRAGKTFRFGEKAQGLLQNKKAYVVSAMGGLKTNDLSLSELHLQQILNYIGLTEIFFFMIDGTTNEEHAHQKLVLQKKLFIQTLNL